MQSYSCFLELLDLIKFPLQSVDYAALHVTVHKTLAACYIHTCTAQSHHHNYTYSLGEYRTFEGEREQAMHYSLDCYITKAIPMKYQITMQHTCHLCMSCTSAEKVLIRLPLFNLTLRLVCGFRALKSTSEYIFY